MEMETTGKVMQGTLCAIALLALAACSVVGVRPSPLLDGGARWAVVPFSNQADAPDAGARAAAIAAARLRLRGLAVTEYSPPPPDPRALPDLDGERGHRAGLAWARRGGFQYILTGSVQEWRYKSGLDGEPAAGITVQVLDAASGRVLWSATGARAGWGRASVAGTAQRLLRRLLAGLRIDRGG